MRGPPVCAMQAPTPSRGRGAASLNETVVSAAPVPEPLPRSGGSPSREQGRELPAARSVQRVSPGLALQGRQTRAHGPPWSIPRLAQPGSSCHAFGLGQVCLAVRALPGAGRRNVAALGAGDGLREPKRRAARDAAGRADGIRREAVFAGQATKALRQLKGSARALGSPLDGCPDALRQLQ